MVAGLKGLVSRLIGDSDEREIARLQTVVEEINSLEPEYENYSEKQLRGKTAEFRRRLARGETLDDLLAEAFAAAREAARRTIGLRHYDVQLIGGVILHQGRIIEMKTGEGKTLVATLPLYLNALDLNPEWTERAREEWGEDPDRWEFVTIDGVPVGRGVHLVTINDYLARRDGGWMGPSFDVLGLRVGLVIPGFSALYDPEYVEGAALMEDDRLVHWRPCPRREAYEADITYGTNNEFGFDYLRDNMVTDLTQCTQRELNYAIIDEIDNVLIDEARTPLIISGPADEPSDLYRRFAQIAARLKRDAHYEIDERTQVVTLTEEGIDRVESLLPEISGGESIYDAEHAHMLPYLDNALHARVIHHRDKDYIVKDGQVIIVDEFTGRLLYGRRYSEGLHQAIEAKENLAIQRENLTYGTITIQNYFRMYQKLAGMTGTAATEEEEFYTIYGLDVIVLPTNVEYRARYGNLQEQQRTTDELDEVTFAGVLNGRQETPVTTYERGNPPQERYFRRLDLSDSIYLDAGSKFRAIVQEIEALHQAKRPVLVGTIAVETSEHLSRLLDRQGIPHNVLNAKKHQQEALVIAQAGRPGAVTIATNMAGRGVDIVLGGSPEGLAVRALRKEVETQLPAILEGISNPKGGTRGKGASETTVRTAQLLSDEYAAYQRAKSEGGSALPVFFAARLITEGKLSPHHRAQGVQLARHILTEAWDRAGELAQQTSGVSMETISHIQRLREKLEGAKDAQDFVTSGLASTHHNLLMKLIRLTLRGKEEAAHALMARYPELPPDIIERINEIHEECRRNQKSVRARGGLHVIGTERHEARRIDNQLRGRAGRQGDPGSSRFYLSLEDELMRRFGGERVQNLMEQMGMGDVPLEFGILSRSVESAQKRVEGYNFDLRKHVLEYDDVVNKQRETIYDQRHQVLSEHDLQDQVLRMVEEEVAALIAAHCAGELPEEWDLKGLYGEIRTFVPLPAESSLQRWAQLSPTEIQEEVLVLAERAYDMLSRQLGLRFYQEALQQEETLARLRRASEPLQRLTYQRVMEHLGDELPESTAESPLGRLPDETQEKIQGGFVEAVRVYRDRQIMLRTVDSLWVRHLTDLAILREGIGLRAFGQQNPLVAFRKEAHHMYELLLSQVQSQVARRLLRVPTLIATSRPPRGLRTVRQSAPRSARRSQEPQPASPPPHRELGRNDPCWCGSGKKYKHCHLREDREASRASTTRGHPSQTPDRRRRRHR
jgi:preprotein translocase subunit SecA